MTFPHRDVNTDSSRSAPALSVSRERATTRGKRDEEGFPGPAVVVDGVALPGRQVDPGHEAPRMIRSRSGANIILFGPPGVGKGVQARTLVETQALGYLSTGDAIREEIRRGTAVGKRLQALTASGRFADDETVLKIVASRLDRDEFRHGFIMDGFPRTLRQAELFDRMLRERGRQVDVALFLRASEATILARLSGRLVCSVCCRSYHSAFDRPRVEGRCDACGGSVARRHDDDPETHRRRLDLYTTQTAPLEEYYGRAGVLVYIDGERPAREVAATVRRAVHRF